MEWKEVWLFYVTVVLAVVGSNGLAVAIVTSIFSRQSTQLLANLNAKLQVDTAARQFRKQNEAKVIAKLNGLLINMMGYTGHLIINPFVSATDHDKYADEISKLYSEFHKCFYNGNIWLEKSVALETENVYIDLKSLYQSYFSSVTTISILNDVALQQPRAVIPDLLRQELTDKVKKLNQRYFALREMYRNALNAIEVNT